MVKGAATRKQLDCQCLACLPDSSNFMTSTIRIHSFFSSQEALESQPKKAESQKFQPRPWLLTAGPNKKPADCQKNNRCPWVQISEFPSKKGDQGVLKKKRSQRHPAKGAQGILQTESEGAKGILQTESWRSQRHPAKTCTTERLFNMRLSMFTIESASASLRFTNRFFLLPSLCIHKNYLVLLLMNQTISWWAFANIIRIATRCHGFLPFQNPWAALIAVFNVL